MPIFDATTLPHYVEFSADGTGVGKTLLSWRTRYLYASAGVRTIMVRLETRGVQKQLHPGDVFIPVEDFTQASSVAGGIAGVLGPLYGAIKEAAAFNGVVIVDWAGGLAAHRAEMMASTRFAERLAGMGVTGLSCVVTTNATDRMRQAAENLKTLQAVAPGIDRCLVRNERLGGFDFIAGSGQAKVHAELMRTARAGGKVITIPAIAGDSWKICEDAGLALTDVIKLDPAAVAARIGTDDFIAAACITETAAWWEATQQEFNRVLRFRPAA